MNEKFKIELSKTEPVVNISVNYTTKDSNGEYQLSIVMAFDKDENLVLDFHADEESINL